MIIDADIHQDDYAAWVAHVRRAALRFDWLDFVVIAMVIVAMVAAERAFDLDVNFVSVLTLALLLAVLTFHFSIRIHKQYQASSGGTILGPHRYEFDESGIGISTRHYDAKFKWSAIQRCEESGNCIFLLLDNTAAIIVPKRSFRDDADLQSFLKMVDENAT